MSPGRRSFMLLVASMVGAVLLVFCIAYLDLRREQQRSLDDFTAEQAALAHAAAGALRAHVAGDADLAGAASELRVITPAEPEQVRWILRDRGGRWAVLGRDADPPAWRHPADMPDDEVRGLLAAMAGAPQGTRVLSRPAAEALGLDRRVAAVGWAPLGVERGEVAVVASARRVRDRAHFAVWRLAAAMGLAGLLVAVFGALVSRQQRRAGRLAEALTIERNLVRTEKLATIGTLAAGIAHEIGTPLGIISGRAEQLLERATDEEAKKPVRSILDNVDKVSTTIRQLLDFARVRPVDAATVTPGLALQHAASLLDHRFRKRKVALQIDAPSSLPPVAADPGQLEQVLVNLMINACDACEAGGHVRVRAADEGARVALEVRDDGVGIPPENLPRVLDPFFTTKKRGQGTGLGLTIVADIVRNHGGSLELESTLGEGTTIRVLLPRAEVRA